MRINFSKPVEALCAFAVAISTLSTSAVVLGADSTHMMVSGGVGLGLWLAAGWLWLTDPDTTMIGS